jgi:hypothetical protein
LANWRDMKITVHAPHGRWWVVTRPVLSWRPRLHVSGVPEGGFERPMVGGAAAVVAPEVVLGEFRKRARRNVSAPWPLYVELPIYLVKMLGYALAALATLAWKGAARRPWTVSASSEHPKPIHHDEAVVGWRESGRRARALASELRSGDGPPWAWEQS